MTPNQIVSLSRSMLASGYPFITLQQKFCRIQVLLLSDSLGILLNFSVRWMQAFFTMKAWHVTVVVCQIAQLCLCERGNVECYALDSRDSVRERVTFATDSQLLCNVVYANYDGISEFSTLVARTRIMRILALHCNFEEQFVWKQAHMAAHSLAREALSYASRQVFDHAPHCIYLMK